MQKHSTYFNWSTGKDSALALYHLLQDERFDVRYLLTTVNSHHGRVSMHGLRRELMELQTESIGIPSGTVELPELPELPDYDDYERLLGEKVLELRNEGFTHAAFGDIFLEDLRTYRENQLSKLGMKAVFPIWKRDTLELANEFIDLGFKATVVCANGQLLDSSFVGRSFDHNFLRDLPKGVDPCGENGEFHTFCHAGPIFRHPIEIGIGETVERTYTHDDTKTSFWFCDLLTVANAKA